MSIYDTLYENALATLGHEGFDAILAQLRDGAEKGNAQAQYRLGQLYGNGEGVDLNYREAAIWYERAARQGHVDAMKNLAWMFASGYGVEQSDDQAGQWYERAAAQGSAADVYFLGTLYQHGRYGKPRDRERMLDCYTRAAQQGHALAQFTLGRLYADGKHVEHNAELAFQWLSLAVVNGNQRAQKALQTLTQGLDATTLEQYKANMVAMMQAQLSAQEQTRQ